jgi:multiple sugar transport system substrate-binding protein
MMKKLLMLSMAFLMVLSFVAAQGGGDAAAPAASAAAGGEFDWRQFEGESIVACFPNHVTYNALMPLIPEFEELTGIDVEVDLLQYIRMHDKQVLEMSKPRGDYDIISMVVMWKTEYAEADLLLPLEPFFENSSLAYPDYDFDDLVPAYVENTGYVGGDKIYLGGEGATLYGIPFGAETSILIYRQDIFDEYDIKVPDNYDELMAAAKFIEENVPGVHGFTSRGASGHQATAAWLLHASPFGASVFDENWEPAFNSREAVASLTWLRDMFQYGPQGMTSFDQDGQFQAFLQGDAAIYLDASVFAGKARDPQQSTVYDKLGYALHPIKENRLSESGGFGLAIPANAQNPEPAFLFMQWMTSKETERKVIENGGAPFRMSSVSDPALQAKYPDFAVLADQLPHVNPDWRPIIPEWGEINNMLGIAINQVLTGEKEPQKAMDELVEPIRNLMVRYGYIK